MKSHVTFITCTLALAWLLIINPTVGIETVFDVTTFGAKPDGIYDNAIELIQAWNAACRSPGPAKVVVPVGNFMASEVVFGGPCTAPAPIDFEIQGNVTAIPDPSMYSNGAWIMFEYVDNLVVTGGGTIDGNGHHMWQYADRKHPLPVSLVFHRAGWSRIENLRLVDSMGFHSKVTDSHDIVVTNLLITAPEDSPNTDGCHVSSSTNVNITDCLIQTGDDCVSIGEGNNNVAVSRITCGPGHGLSIGSLGKHQNEQSLQGVVVSNCTLTGTTNGVRIKTYHNSPKMSATGLVFEDIVMNSVKNPIVINQHYDSNPNSMNQQSDVKIMDAHFRKIRGTTVSAVAVALNCSRTNPCEGVELADIDLVPIGFSRPLAFVCSNAKTTLTGKLIPPPPAQCL